jgi:PAS domain S-box-containing protein
MNGLTGVAAAVAVGSLLLVIVPAIMRFQTARGYRAASALLRDCGDIISVVDRQLRRRFVSESYLWVLGYKPSDLLGKSVLDLVHPDDLPEVEAALTSCRRHGGERQLRLRVQHANGSWRRMVIVARSHPQETPFGGLVLTARDETDEREVQYRLQQSRRMELLGRMASGVAHDVNNLLTIVIGNLSIGLEDGHIPPEDAAEARDAARRAAALSHQLVSFACGQGEGSEVGDLNAALRSIAPLLKRLAGGDVRIDLILAPSAWPVQCEASQFEQLVLNLTINAREAMKSGGILEIRTRNVIISQRNAEVDLEAGEYVRLDVGDTGTGIDADVLPHIFEPFFTTKASLPDERGGSGIGLATVRSVMQALGGYVKVRTDEGAGTTFSVYFPRRRGAGTIQPD